MAHTITPLGSPVEWQTVNAGQIGIVEVDSTHWLVTYVFTSNVIHAVIFTVDGSGVPSMIGTPFAVDSPTSSAENWAVPVMYDSDTAIVAYKGTDNDGFIRALSINTSTWAVTSGGSALEFETDALTNHDIVKVPGMDAVVVVARATAGNDGHSYSITFDSGTGAFTLVDNFEFDTGSGFRPTICNINGDATKYLVGYEGVSADGFLKVLSLNTSTWDLTEQSALEFDTTEGRFVNVEPLDANHFLVTWNNITAGTAKAQVFAVNLSTWAITAVGSSITIPVAFINASGEGPNNLTYLDHVSNYYRFARVFRDATNNRTMVECLIVDDTTWAVTLDGTATDMDTVGATNPIVAKVSSTRALVLWTETSTNDGFARSVDISSGTTPEEGEALGDISWVGNSFGTTMMAGSATGAIAWVGASDGAFTPQGAPAGAVAWVGEATGTSVHSGEATGAINWVGVSTGVDLGFVFGDIAWAGSATGTSANQGEAIGDLDWVGEAHGEETAIPVNGGTADGAIDWAGSSTGAAVHQGMIGSNVTWVGSATGMSGFTMPLGEAIGAIEWVGVVTGADNGIAVGAIEWVGVVIGFAPFDAEAFLLKAHVTGYIPKVLVGHSPGIVKGRDGG